MGGGGKFCFFLLSLVNDFLSPYFWLQMGFLGRVGC